MKPQAPRSPLLFLLGAAATQVGRRPYLSSSVAAHAVLLALLYYFGSYQLELREQEAEVASSLRATHQASAAKRLQDLQTIKQLLEKSADRVNRDSGPGPATAAPPQTPEQMVEQAREVSKAIDSLDKKIQAKELAELTGKPKPPPPAEAASAAASPPEARNASVGRPAPVTQEMAANEIAALEAEARATLARRLKRLEAKADGVQVEGAKHGAGGEPDAGGEGTGAKPGTGGSLAASSPVKGSTPDTSVRAEIADFMRTGDLAEHAEPSKRYSGSDFFDRGTSRVPPVDAMSMVRGSGRMLGAGGEYANRVYLNSWYLIGPFPGRHEAGLFDNPSYPPEKAVLLDAVYYGKDKRLLRWRYVTSQSYPLVPPDMVEDSVYYGYTEVYLDQARNLTAWIGADDDVQLYLNDRLVWKGGNVNKQSYFDAIFNTGTAYLHDYNRTEGQRVLHFDKGRNKIFFKLSNGPNSAFLSLVLTP